MIGTSIFIYLSCNVNNPFSVVYELNPSPYVDGCLPKSIVSSKRATFPLKVIIGKRKRRSFSLQSMRAILVLFCLCLLKQCKSHPGTMPQHSLGQNDRYKSR